MGNCAGLLRFLQVLRIIYIDDSYAKFIFTSSSNILSSLGNRQFFYGKLCLTACCVTWTRQVWNQTKYSTEQNAASSLTNEFLWKKYSYLDSIKKCSLNISSWNALRVARPRKLQYPQKTQLGSLCKLCAMWIDALLDWLLFWRSNFIMIRFGSPERDYLLSNGDTCMTLEKGLRSQHIKDVQLHDSLGSPTSSKRTSYNFC